MDRLKNEHQTDTEHKRLKVETLEKQIEQLKDDIKRKTEQNAQISAKQAALETKSTQPDKIVLQL